MSKSQVFIGTSGYYQQNFYPQGLKGKEKLEFYAKTFNSVEINSSFYHTPRESSMLNWLSAVTDEFQFTFKIFQGFTRFKQEVNREKLLSWLKLFEAFANRKNKTVMLYQFPASFVFSQKRLESLMLGLPDCFLYAFEFRDQSWFNELVYQKLKDCGYSLVLSDSPVKKSGETMWPKVDLDADFSFIRFHGSSQMYASPYDNEELEEYGQLVKQKVANGKNVYCYFNNDARGFAVKNARKLQKILNK